MSLEYLNKSADKLNELICGSYNEVLGGNPWGMEEYDHFEKKYIIPFSEDERVEIFRKAYDRLGLENIEDNIQRLFYLASAYRVKFSKEYVNILKSEVSEKKKEVFLKKAIYYIEDRWSESAKSSLSPDGKKVIEDLCCEYGLNSPFN